MGWFSNPFQILWDHLNWAGNKEDQKGQAESTLPIQGEKKSVFIDLVCPSWEDLPQSKKEKELLKFVYYKKEKIISVVKSKRKFYTLV